MSYVEENLMRGETIQYQTRVHWIVYAWPIALGLFGLIALTGSASTAMVFFVLAAVIGVVAYISATNSEFAVTNKRVLIKVGWINRRSLELLLTKVESIAVEQGLGGKLFGFGTIVVSGTGGSHEPFKNIADPFEFRKQIQEQTSAAQDSGRVLAPTAQAPSATRAERECPYCAETILAKARVCKHCGKEVEPLPV
jgi:uncharacterized membrane protein YdbT with pleckstrin-like domain